MDYLKSTPYQVIIVNGPNVSKTWFFFHGAVMYCWKVYKLYGVILPIISQVFLILCMVLGVKFAIHDNNLGKSFHFVSSVCSDKAYVTVVYEYFKHMLN